MVWSFGYKVWLMACYFTFTFCLSKAEKLVWRACGRAPICQKQGGNGDGEPCCPQPFCKRTPLSHFHPSCWTWTVVKFVWWMMMQWRWVFLRSNEIPMQCIAIFLETRYHRYWRNYLDLTIIDDVFWRYDISQFLVGFHDFPRFFFINDAQPTGPMFLRFIDHHMPLFPIVVNHRSNDAMYRSSLHLTFCSFLTCQGRFISRNSLSSDQTQS